MSSLVRLGEVPAAEESGIESRIGTITIVSLEFFRGQFGLCRDLRLSLFSTVSFKRCLVFVVLLLYCFV